MHNDLIKLMREKPRMNLTLHQHSPKKSVQNTCVLLIENGEHESEALKSTLESRGFLVRTIVLAPTEIFEKQTPEPDIIILDANSQLMDCFGTLQAIRRVSNAPLLVLSTFDHPNMIARTLDCGADDFITKPVSAEVLTANINKLTRRARSNKQKEPPSG